MTPNPIFSNPNDKINNQSTPSDPKQTESISSHWFIAVGIGLAIVLPMIFLVIPIINQTIQQDKEIADRILDESIPLEQRCLTLRIADITIEKGNPLASNTLNAIEKLKSSCKEFEN